MIRSTYHWGKNVTYLFFGSGELAMESQTHSSKRALRELQNWRAQGNFANPFGLEVQEILPSSMAKHLSIYRCVQKHDRQTSCILRANTVVHKKIPLKNKCWPD